MYDAYLLYTPTYLVMNPKYLPHNYWQSWGTLSLTFASAAMDYLPQLSLVTYLGAPLLRRRQH